MMASMSGVFASLSEEPLLLLLVLAVVGAMIFAVIKHVVRLAVIVLIGFVAVMAFYAYTGEEPPDELRKIADKAGEKLEEGLEKSGEKAREVGRELGERIGEAAKKEIGRRMDDAEDSSREALQKVLEAQAADPKVDAPGEARELSDEDLSPGE